MAATPARGGVIVVAVWKEKHGDGAEGDAASSSAAAAAAPAGVTSRGGSGTEDEAGLRILLLGLEQVSGTAEC